MLTRLRCTHFRGIRSLDVELASITAFLGPNSSGKTTVLHAIRLACDALRLMLDGGGPVRLQSPDDNAEDWLTVSDGALIDPARLLPLADWRALFVDQEVGEGAAFEVELTFAEHSELQAIWVRVSCARNEQLKLALSVRSARGVERVRGIGRRSAQVSQRLVEYLNQYAPVAVFVPPFYGTVPSEEARARVVIDRLLGSGDQSHVVRNLVAGLDIDQFERLNAFLHQAIGATLTYRTTGDALQTESPLRIRFRDTNGELELSAAGAGLVNLVALYASLSRWRREARDRPVLFLLDEPEAHLHPRLQAESTAALAGLVTREFGAQLAIATHSVDILNRLADDGHRLVRIDRSAGETAVVLDGHSALFDDLAGWVDLTPYTAINFLASRRVLFVEGRDERALLPRLAALRYRNDPARLQRFQRWSIVKLDGIGNDKVPKLLARLVESEAVRARVATAGGFVVGVLCDRDYSRAPGTTMSDVDGVREIQVVWSQHSLESLLLEPAVLTVWVQAFLGAESPPDLAARVVAAVASADVDPALHDDTVQRLTTARVVAHVREGARVLADDGRLVREASAEAQAQAREQPATWQRGKDRAAHVLGKLREGLAPSAQGQFPTDVVRLVERADPNRIGLADRGIPAEVDAVLELLTQP
jgi:energy-coupling factor transporter ATP-binding protein EcfA2